MKITENGTYETEEKNNMRGGGGTVTISHFFKKDDFTSKCRLCAKLTIPPGAGIGLHQHEGEDEVYIITSGTGKVNDGEKNYPVAPGDTVLTGNGESHSISNTGTEDLELIAVIILY